jgi:hypothetical protein
MSECRRCGECRDREHHWLDNPDFGADPEWLAEYEDAGNPEHSHVCKHCDAYGDECEYCEGEGCEECDGEGVVTSCQ